jgi:hypothetical protein
MCLECHDKWLKGSITASREVAQGELFADIKVDASRKRKRRRR